MRLSILWRLFTIQFVLYRHGLDEIVFALHIFRPLRFLRYFSPWYWFSDTYKRPRGDRLVSALEDLGPIFVKFGQMLSTRRDLLPEDIANSLTKLQDRVRPFAAEQVVAVIEKRFGLPVDEVFAQFDRNPLASASIAQVHAATLKSGEPVIVKIVRPGIEKRIRRDLEIMYIIANLAERYWSEGPRLHPVEVVREFDKTLMDELDLQREAANAAELKRQFDDSGLLYIPKIYWENCRSDVLVQERIHGIPIADTAALLEAGVDMKKLAERGVEIFFTQVFRNNFFHADMHPGNIFVDASNPADPTYIAVDFGIVGSLTPEDQRYLAENFHAFFNRDYKRVAELHVESGWVPRDTRIEEFESAIRTVSEPIFQKPLKEISFGHFLLRLFQIARRFQMEVQPQLVLLQKTLLAIEGLGRQLYPDLDLWKTAKPFIESWLKEQIGPKAFFKKLRKELPFLTEYGPEWPRLAIQALQATEQQQVTLAAQQREIQRLSAQIERSSRRQGLITIGGALIVSGFIVKGLDGWAPKVIIAGAPLDTWLLLSSGVLLLLIALSRR